MTFLHIPAEYYDLTRMDFPTSYNDGFFIRLEKLIHHHLRQSHKDIYYELCGKVFKQKQYPKQTMYYGLNFHLDKGLCVVFSVQQDIRHPVAIFPIRRRDIAAEYFVWLVSEGTLNIDWNVITD
jgi:hypothetical protein